MNQRGMRAQLRAVPAAVFLSFILSGGGVWPYFPALLAACALGLVLGALANRWWPE